MAVTFDTHKAIRRLEAAGIKTQEAEAFTDVLKDAQEGAELVTKKDLEIALAPIRTDISVLKWMLGFVLSGVVALVLRAFLL